MQRIYNGVIFTNHALERLEQRNIKQGDAWATLSSPTSSRASKSRDDQRKGAHVFYRTYGKRTIEVVASKNDRGEWVVLSVWDKEASSKNYSQKFKRTPIWKRVLLELKSIFFR